MHCIYCFFSFDRPRWFCGSRAKTSSNPPRAVPTNPFDPSSEVTSNTRLRHSVPILSIRDLLICLSVHLLLQGWIGLYRGYVSTIVRDLPCALIQFPIWEALKGFFARRNYHRQLFEEGIEPTGHSSIPPPSTENLTGFQFMLCGFLSGAIAGSVTTPLDVAKTRIMLAEVRSLYRSYSLQSAYFRLLPVSSFHFTFFLSTASFAVIFLVLLFRFHCFLSVSAT